MNVETVGDDSVQLLEAGLLGEDHGAQAEDVGEPVEEDALRRLVVATGTPRLLKYNFINLCLAFKGKFKSSKQIQI